ncbi:hypothetical protein U9890_23590, partial [Escherichia coli]
MTIEYFATRIAKHISVQAIWPDGRTEIIAVLPRDALSGLVTRNNQLIHIAFDAMGTRNRETVLIDCKMASESIMIWHPSPITVWHHNRSRFGCFRSLIGILPVTPGINSFHH